MNSPATSSTTAANRNTCQGWSTRVAKSVTQATTVPSTVTTQENTEAQAMMSITTEVSVAVVDMSVLALKGNPKKNPLVFFYDGFPLVVSTGSNLENELKEVDVKAVAFKGGDEHGPSIVPHEVAKSPLIALVTSREKDERMPPKGDGLSEAEIQGARLYKGMGCERCGGTG